jgi:putative PIN family toxin of toxin-antitoxin system
VRIVLDTNIFISAVLGGTLGIIMDEWRAGKFTLIALADIAREYLDVIHRAKFKIAEGEIAAVIDYLLRTTEFVTPKEDVNIVAADPSDNKFLEAALAGYADFIVSGDGHLLELKQFRNIPVITAREFAARPEGK